MPGAAGISLPIPAGGLSFCAKQTHPIIMKIEKGKLSVQTGDIFPLIQKYLYSDEEIFLRELVSNAVDATQKLKTLVSTGDYTEDLGDLTIDVSIDEKRKVLKIEDRGVGMTLKEVKKYINSIALSGASAYLEKFKDVKDANELIGHFGLGFYSSFMVAKKVEIDTLSYLKDSEPVHWSCEGDTSFELSASKRSKRGTLITLHLDTESGEKYLQKATAEEVLRKYGKFLPVPVRFEKKETQVKDGKDEDGNTKYKTSKVDNIINSSAPLWLKNASGLKAEDYTEFYQSLYPTSQPPLFWIHLNVDHPFRLTGILYFPKILKGLGVQKEKIHLYVRQVFITDKVENVVPDFLQLLHGVIDSPEIPLNVSRSYLQGDPNIKKIGGYITRKVADTLQGHFKDNREEFQQKWEDVGVFVKYGMISDEKFAGKAAEFTLLKNTKGKHYTIEEYKKLVSGQQTDKDEKINFLYTTDLEKQYTYVTSATERGYDVLVMDEVLDSHFLGHLEQYFDVNVRRVDSQTMEKIVDKGETREGVLSEKETEALKGSFDKVISDKKIKVSVESLSPEDMPVVVTFPEFMRRMRDMQMTGGGPQIFGDLPVSYTVIVNANHSLSRKILDMKNSDEKHRLIRHAYDLGLLSQGALAGEGLSQFIRQSVEISSA